MKALFVGDLHITDVAVGKHKDYWGNCLKILEDITNVVKEKEITHLFFSGDLIGTTRKELKERSNLLNLIIIFQHLNSLVGGRVYSIAGNHDMSGKTTDFELFKALGLIKKQEYVDVDTHLRVHMFDYGEEERNITLCTATEAVNVALMHNTFTVESVFNVPFGRTLELTQMSNLEGVDLVLAGDYHEPSATIQATIGTRSSMLMYLGCPTRPTYKTGEMWDSVNFVIMETESGNSSVKLDVLDYKLLPLSEVFKQPENLAEQVLEIEDDKENQMRGLQQVFDTLANIGLHGNSDFIAMAKAISNGNDKVADKAIGYLIGAGYKTKVE